MCDAMGSSSTYRGTERHPGDKSVLTNDELYLSDDLIDAWAQCVRSTRPAVGGGVYQWLTSPVRKFLDCHRQPAAVNDVMRHVLSLKRLGLDLLKQRAWVLPHVRDRHWTSVVVDFRAKLVISVDPLLAASSLISSRVLAPSSMSCLECWPRTPSTSLAGRAARWASRRPCNQTPSIVASLRCYFRGACTTT